MTTKDYIAMKENVQEGVNHPLTQRHSPERIFPPQPESCELTLRCRRADYSASIVARAVEDCDAHLLNLNVTSITDDVAPEENYLFVDLRVGLRNADSVVRSLSRYGYDVVDVVGGDYSSNSLLGDTLRDRLDLLLFNLEI